MSTFRNIVHIPIAVGRYVLMLALVAFVSFLNPNQLTFKYEYEKGRSWAYEDLTAPFDIPLLKSEADLALEKASIIDEFPPCYRVDPNIGPSKTEAFQAGFDKQFNSIRADQETAFQDVLSRSDTYRQYGSKLLGRIYQRGILEPDPAHLQKGKEQVVNILTANTLKTQTLQNIPSPTQVKRWLGDTLLYQSGLPEAEFLIPVLEENIAPNLLYDDSLTQKMLARELSQVTTTRGLIPAGEPIINKGSLITEELYDKLSSFEARYLDEFSVKMSFWQIFSGHILLTTLVIGIYLLYLSFNEPRVFQSFRNLLFMATWVALFSYLVHLVEDTVVLSAYMIPFCIVPIVIKNFFNDRLALFTHIVIVLIASFLSTLGYEFTFLHILAGIVAVLTNTETRYWSKFFLSLFFIMLSYGIGFFGLSLIQGADWTAIDWRTLGFFLLNVILTLLAYPLIPLLEKVFGFTSSITLAELGDLNRPLLKELAIKAPGTLQHSIQVSHLSEAAARKIGADSLLVKTAALYHDVGKMKHPGFFIENQSGEANPHQNLGFLDSAKHIISHVTEGIRLARKHRLPRVLADFIPTHHGTTRVEFFYRNYVNSNPDGEISESEFRYPGPKPTTKEHTIMMMADSLEAASKSLSQPVSGSDIDNLVDRIISSKIADGQLDQSALTFDELEQCKNVFKAQLRSIHHVRIQYPDEKKRKDSENPV